uniref:Phage tail protein n=1 Tax=Agrobacterium albertimagni TaxID=147266 RepID=A0A7C1P0K5_9HYPH
MMKLLFKRPDGSFVAEINGLPYHVEVGSDLHGEAQEAAKKLGEALKFEPIPAVPEPTVADYENAIQAHVDQTARTKQFRDGVTLSSYAASTNPQWVAEAQAFISWRDAVWGYAYAEFARVQAGQREQPTISEVLSELPAITWPEV